MKKCPFCAEEIQDEAMKCRYCGEFLSPPQSSSPLDTNKHVETTVSIHRPPRKFATAGAVEIFCDEQKVGDLKAGQTIAATVKPGRHRVMAKSSWCKSNTVSFDIKEQETVKLVCAIAGRFKMAALQGIGGVVGVLAAGCIPGTFLSLKFSQDNENQSVKRISIT